MPRRDLLTVLAVALLLRLLVALFWHPEPVTDAADYLRLAQGLLDGEGFVNTRGEPTSWRPPGYPAFLAAVFGVVGPQLGVVRGLQALLATGSVFLVFLLGSAWFGRKVGLIASGLLAINAAHVWTVSRMLSETVFVFVFLLSVWFLQRGVMESKASRGWLMAAGVAMGVGTLLRGILLPFPILVVAALVVLRPVKRTSAIVLCVTFAATLAPWTLRNQGVHDAFVPVTTQVGATLYAGNHPRDGWVFGVMAEDARTSEAESLSEVEASTLLTHATLSDWASEPAALPRLTLLKMLYFWVPADWELLPWYGVFNPTFALLLCGMAVWMVPGLGRRPGLHDAEGPSRAAGWREIWPLWLPVAFFLVVAVVFYGSPRLRMPVEPFFCIWAALGYERFAARVGEKRSRIWALSAALVLLGFVAVWEPTKALLSRGVMALGGGL